MRRNIIWAVVTTLIVGAGITFQVVGTTSHEVKDDAPAHEQTSEAPVAPAPDTTEAPSMGDPETPAPSDEQKEGETNDQEGKPGEGSKG